MPLLQGNLSSSSSSSSSPAAASCSALLHRHSQQLRPAPLHRHSRALPSLSLRSLRHRHPSLLSRSHLTDFGEPPLPCELCEVSWDARSSLFCDLPFPASACYVPQPELLDPLPQLVFQHALRGPGRNMHWWRFLLFCRGQMNSSFAKETRYALVSKHYTKLLLPSRRYRRLVLPRFPRVLDHLALLKEDTIVWFQLMGNRYGTPLLLLLVLSYWIQGFRCFPWLAVAYHLKDGLQVDPAMLQFLQSSVNLPMAAKPIYGIISDAIYIRGARRMPYLMIAGILQVFSWSTVALHPGVGSSVGSMIGILVLSNVGAAIAEVVSDALVAESVQKERGNSKGELQSLVWLALAMGGVAGNLSGGFALSRLPSTAMFAIFSTLLAAQLVACALVREDAFGFKLVARKKKPEQGAPAASIAQVVRLQASKLIDLVAKPEIVQPLAWFAASYAVIPTLGGSLFFFQTQHLRINPTFLGLAKVIGQTGLVLASLLFNRFLKHSSPRRVLASLQILLALCMLCDIALVCRLNLRAGIPDHLFVLGASAFVEAIAQFKLLPFTVLLTQLCPAGSEASLLAAFMSCHCLASIFSGYFGTALASLLHLSAENFTGLPLGILIQSLAALVPLLWVSSIPNSYGKAVAARA